MFLTTKKKRIPQIQSGMMTQEYCHSLRPAWDTQQAPGQSKLQCENLYQKQRKECNIHIYVCIMYVYICMCAYALYGSQGNCIALLKAHFI